MNEKKKRAAFEKLHAILASDPRMKPIYRSDITSEESAKLIPDLPGLAIWDEAIRDGYLHFRMTVNTKILLDIVRQVVPMSDPLFDQVFELLRKAWPAVQEKAIHEACGEIGKMPSALYTQAGWTPVRPINVEEYKQIRGAVISMIMSDRNLSTPYYRDDIKTEKMADRGSDMPLFYFWNEKVLPDGQMGLSFTVNTAVIAGFLEPIIPRSDPSFVALRDEIASVLEDVVWKSSMETCTHAKVPPSVLFSPRFRPGMVEA